MDIEAKLATALDESLRSRIYIKHYENTDSTNLRAKEYSKESSCDALFIADAQSAGRGRLGRSFHSKSGGLYMSILYHPKGAAQNALKMTALASVALSYAIEKLTPLSPRIKWVNDVTVEDKKIAGILAEGLITPNGELDYAVVGIGVNLAQSFPKELLNIAGSIGDFCNPPDRVALAAEATNAFFALTESADIAAVLEYYKKRSSVIGEHITVYRGADAYGAIAVDINDDFHLIIERDNGIREALSMGEVSIRRDGQPAPDRRMEHL